jgi:hypothetical protein
VAGTGCRRSRVVGQFRRDGRRGPGYRARRGDGADRGGRGAGAARRRVQRDAGPGAAPGRPRDGLVTGLAALEPDPPAPGADVLLDAALQAATGLQQLLAFRHDCTTVTTPAEQAAATAGPTSAAAELGKAAEALHGLIELAEMTGRSGRTGKTDLN